MSQNVFIRLVGFLSGQMVCPIRHYNRLEATEDVLWSMGESARLPITMLSVVYDPMGLPYHLSRNH
jgi:hypothetical protein